jgi:alkylation response protein AidB-like acyl-CoA dehydrogenase
VRCFVGDAMVFRSLGEVDEALSAVDYNDPAVALKTIEQFAIECSINKVWSSEALAYVVDEALQVYGGNGYSREFPAERAYRDARITRIYEGTNEINRIIVGTRLARSAEVASQIADAASNGLDSAKTQPPLSGPLTKERGLLGRAKEVTRFALGAAAQKFGKGLSAEQEVVSRLADMAIEIYALESAILRAEKMQPRGAGLAATALDIVHVFAADAADRLEHAAKNALAAIDPPDLIGTLGSVHTMLGHGPVNTIAHRRRIADAVIDAGRYPL